MKNSNHFVSGKNNFFLLVFLSILISGCTSGGASRHSMNTRISISYATVVSVEQVQLESEAGKAAAIGGLWGLLGNSSGDRQNMLGGALLGATLLGGAAKIAEGSNTAFGYILKDKFNKEFKILTEQDGIQVDDCVAVETGAHTNLRRVSNSHCQSNSGNSGIGNSQLQQTVSESAECRQVKEQLLSARGEEFDAVVRKVKAICDD